MEEKEVENVNSEALKKVVEEYFNKHMHINSSLNILPSSGYFSDRFSFIKSMKSLNSRVFNEFSNVISNEDENEEHTKFYVWQNLYNNNKLPNYLFDSQIEDRLKRIEEQTLQNSNELKRIKSSFIDFVNENLFESKTQFLPIDIYLDTDDPREIFKIYSSVLDFIKSIGFEKDIELDPIKGSWILKMIAKSKEKLTDKQVTDRLKEIEYALEVKILKDQSEVDKNQSAALADIMKSMENIQHACVKIGSILVLKITSESGTTSLQVRTLSILELHYINKNPHLLNNPGEILTKLATLANQEQGDQKLN